MSAAEVLAQHGRGARPISIVNANEYYSCRCGESPLSLDGHAQHQVDALKVAGYAVAPIRLLEELTDPDPCSWDHNHSCQAHGYFYIDQGDLCPVEEAKQLLAADAAEADR